MHRLALLVVLTTGCTNDTAAPWPDDPHARDHDPRFHGWWIVEQPTHALYEATYYDFRADGTLVTGPSVPDDCSGHLARHCVTGSVANCVPSTPGETCTSALTCVFDDGWYSLDAAHVVIKGACSDGRSRDIEIEMRADTSSNAEPGGAGGRLVSVDNDPAWSHDNWAWGFRKCPAGPAGC